jgi:hypothetical protein
MTGPARQCADEWIDPRLLDPRREIEKHRDHPASHDKPLAFLMGAGEPRTWRFRALASPRRA